jgi:ATP-binding cassette, subfamily B, bacterial
MFGTAWRAAPGLSVLCAMASVGTAFFGLVYPLGFRAVVDGAARHHEATAVAGVAIVAVAVPATWALAIVGASLNSRLTDEAHLGLALQLGKIVTEAPYLEHFEDSGLLAEIDNIRERRRTLAGAPAQVLGLARSGAQFAGAAVLLALIWPPLLVVPLLAVAPAIADRRAAAVEKGSDDELADQRRLIAELFSLASTARPARELRNFGITGAIQARVERLESSEKRSSLRAARVAAAWESAGWALYAAGFAGAVLALVLRAAHGTATAGEVVEAVSVLRRSQRQVAGATSNAGSFAAARTVAERMLRLQDYSASLLADGEAKAPSALRQGIGFEGVSFSYPGRSEPTLQDIDVFLPAGATVALVGDNGAGKSTLVKLLTGMYPPTSGRISVDGVDLAAVPAQQWREATTATFQDFVQFQMPLGDGVGAGDLPRIEDRAAVVAAVERSGGTTLLAELPNGADTLLGPWVGGRSLSEGQWQRLALARGLMRQSPLLVVLDEPTASLDAPTEAALFARYAEMAKAGGREHGSVTVLVSHRFSTVHMADRIVVLAGGRVVETGDHASLMAAGGLYAELFSLQAKGYQ